jgi:hemoglobin
MTEPATDGDPGSLYNLVGGVETFRRLVDAFYRGVVYDPVLRPLYPPSLDESREWLAIFVSH